MGKRDRSGFEWIEAMKNPTINIILALVFAFSLSGTVHAQSTTPYEDYSARDYYRSSDGRLVHRPSREVNNAFGHETAVCRDGSHSYSHHHAGTCSHHGGVDHWD